MPPLAASLDLCSSSKCVFCRHTEDELRASVELAISGTEQNFVLPILPIEFPRSFEQLEELADNFLFRGIRNDAYHRRALLAQRRHGRLVRPQPFLKNDEAKQDFVIVLPPGGMLLETARARRSDEDIDRSWSRRRGEISVILLSMAPRNQSSTTLTANPRFGRFRIELGKIGSAHLAVQPFPRTIASL